MSCWASSERRRSPRSNAARGGRQERQRRRADLHARQRLAQLLGGGRHHGRVERAVHVQQPGLDPARAREVEQPVDAAVQARGDDLARGSCSWPATPRRPRGRAPRRPRRWRPAAATICARRRRRDVGGGVAARLHQAQGLLEAQAAAGHQRRVLAQRVAHRDVAGRRRSRGPRARPRPSSSGSPAGSCGSRSGPRRGPRSRGARGRTRGRRWPPRRCAGPPGRPSASARPMPTCCAPWPGKSSAISGAPRSGRTAGALDLNGGSSCRGAWRAHARQPGDDRGPVRRPSNRVRARRPRPPAPTCHDGRRAPADPPPRPLRRPRAGARAPLARRPALSWLAPRDGVLNVWVRDRDGRRAPARDRRPRPRRALLPVVARLAAHPLVAGRGRRREPPHPGRRRRDRGPRARPDAVPRACGPA